MITIENYLIAEKGHEAVWALFNDVCTIAECVPTSVSYEKIDDDTVNCNLRLKLGMIPLDSKCLMRITKREGNRRLIAEGQTEAGEMLKKFGKMVTESTTKLHITVDFEAIGPNQTQIHFCIKAHAVGQMRRIYESVIRGQRAKLEAKFIENVKTALGAKVYIRGTEAT